MNTLKIKTDKSNRFVYQLTDNLNLKNSNKNIALANLTISKYMDQLGMMNSIYPMDLILFFIFKIILNT